MATCFVCSAFNNTILHDAWKHIKRATLILTGQEVICIQFTTYHPTFGLLLSVVFSFNVYSAVYTWLSIGHKCVWWMEWIFLYSCLLAWSWLTVRFFVNQGHTLTHRHTRRSKMVPRINQRGGGEMSLLEWILLRFTWHPWIWRARDLPLDRTSQRVECCLNHPSF